MKLFDMRSAYMLASQLYGIEADNFEDIALVAWELIGNKHTRLYRFVSDTNHNGELELPCNVDIIKSVHVPIPDAATGYFEEFDRDSILIEKYIDKWKNFEDPEYTKGKLIKYIEGNNTLYFAHPYKNVMIVYKGIIADDDSGLPLITEKERQAIAAYIAYASLYKDGIKRKDGNSINISQDLYGKWLRLCNNARVSEYLSDNDLDKILDARTNWNRKAYGRSYTATF